MKVVRAFVCGLLVFGSIRGQSYEMGEATDLDYVDRGGKYGNKFLCLTLGICSLFPPGRTEHPKFKVVKQWNHIEFDYPSEAERQADIASGEFVTYQTAPIDVDVYYSPISKSNKIFVAMPRFQAGSPATLGTVTNKERDGNPLVAPYPDWSWHRNPTECRPNRIVSVFRVMIDKCNRMWVLDTGKYIDKQVCPPQILAFDLETNAVVHRHDVPQSLLLDMTLLVTPVVDVRETCEDTFIYAADCQTNSIFIHDVKTSTTWKAADKTMYPDPAYGTYNIQGDSFELMDGVLGMALEPYVPGRERMLFYHALSSATEQYVPTSQLRNSQAFLSNPQSSPSIFQQYKGKRDTQSAAEAINKDGIMFFGLIKDVKMACFNTRDQYRRDTIDIIADDPVTLQFPSGVKIIRNKKKVEELWILTSRFQKVMNANLDRTGPNFRIMAAKVEDVVFGTRCKKARRDNEPGGPYGHRP